MDVKELKQIIKDNTSVLVLDDGEPSFVILDYPSYKNLLEKSGSKTSDRGLNSKFKQGLDNQEVDLLERLNKEILAIKNQIEEEEKRQESDQR